MTSIINLIKKSKSFHFYEKDGMVSLTADNIKYKLEGKSFNLCQSFIEDNLHFGKNLKTVSIKTRYGCEHDNEKIIFPKGITHLTLPNMLNINMNKLKNIEYLHFNEDFGIDHKIINTLPKSLKELYINVFYGYEDFHDDLLKKCEELGIIYHIDDEAFNNNSDEEFYYNNNKEYYHKYEKHAEEESDSEENINYSYSYRDEKYTLKEETSEEDEEDEVYKLLTK